MTRQGVKETVTIKRPMIFVSREQNRLPGLGRMTIDEAHEEQNQTLLPLSLTLP